MRSLLHHQLQQWLLHDGMRDELLLQQLLLHGQCTGDLLHGRCRLVAEYRDDREQERTARHQGGAGVDRIGSRQSLTEPGSEIPEASASREQSNSRAKGSPRAGVLFSSHPQAFRREPAASSIVAAWMSTIDSRSVQ